MMPCSFVTFKSIESVLSIYSSTAPSMELTFRGEGAYPLRSFTQVRQQGELN